MQYAKKEENVVAKKEERKIVERVVYKRPVTSNKTNITVIRGTKSETVSVKNEPTVIRK